jgi:signal transduction histidine kinase
MIKRIKQFFTPPTFADEDKTRRARNSFSLALVGLGTSALLAVIFGLLSPENTLRNFSIIFSILVALLEIVMLHKGYVRATILVQAGIIWVSVVAVSISTGGIRSMGFVGGTIASLLVMGTWLEWRSMVFLIIASILAAIGLVWGEAQGLVDPNLSTDKPILMVSSYSAFLFVVSGLLYVTNRSINQALAKARLELSERRRVEAEREKLITELESRNAELERFAYTLSHELKTPLVTMRGFLGYLEEAVTAGKVEQARSDLARITRATDNMHHLIKELLELSVVK